MNLETDTQFNERRPNDVALHSSELEESVQKERETHGFDLEEEL